jgi:hypothetical protein
MSTRIRFWQLAHQQRHGYTRATRARAAKELDELRDANRQRRRRSAAHQGHPEGESP